MSENEGSGDETADQGTVEQTDEVDRVGQLTEELVSLKGSMEAMQAGQSQLLQALKPTEKVEPQLTEKQLQEMASNPAQAAIWLKGQVEDAKTSIKTEAQKQIWDQNAYTEYPILKTDQAFQKQVIRQMQEFTSTKEYAPDHPKLLYRAAQLVAGKYVQPAKKQTSQQATSMEPRTGMGRKTEGSTTNKIDDNDPRVRFLKAYGITDPKKVEKFKSQLGPYQPSQRKAKRVLSR